MKAFSFRFTTSVLLILLMPVFLPGTRAQLLDTCGCEDKPQVDVLALVNGVRIRKQDIGAEAHDKITTLQNTVVEARNRELDLQINNILLDSEAHARGISPAQLLQLEVTAKAVTPTAAEARAFYSQNKERMARSFADSKAGIIAFLKSERERQLALSFAAALRAAANVNVLTNNVTPPANEADKRRVFATVNGRNITSRDIEDSLRPFIYRVQQQVYELRKAELELRINDLLLDQQAAREGLTPAALLEREVKSKVAPVTDAEVLTFYNQNKKQINSRFEKVKFQLLQFLTNQEERRLNSAYAERLRRAASVQVFLEPPEPPALVDVASAQPAQGSTTGELTVIEFTDFTSSSSARAYTALGKLLVEYSDRVRFVVRNFPLATDTNGLKAAEAAEAAREQGRYWEYIFLLYNNQSQLQVSKLKEFATMVGLDRSRFDAALDSGRYGEKVQADIMDARKAGVATAPVFFVNGRRVSDGSYEALKSAIEAALKDK